MKRTNREPYYMNSYIGNSEFNTTGYMDDYVKDRRNINALKCDGTVKWFDDIACKGVTIDQSFLQKDLDRIEVGDMALSDYCRNLQEGETFELYFEHVDTTVLYRVVVKGYVSSKEYSDYHPCVLNFVDVIMKKEAWA